MSGFINPLAVSTDEQPIASPSSESKQQSNVSDLDSQRHLPYRDFLLAATLVTDAKQGNQMQFKQEEKYVRSYLFHNHWVMRSCLYLFVLLDLSLAIYEKPAVPRMALPYWVTMVLEMMCLIFFTLRFCHTAHFSVPSIFWRDKKHYTLLTVIILTVLDMIIYIALVESGVEGAVRWSRPLRPLFLLNLAEGRHLRRAFRNIRRTLPDIMNVFILFLMMVSLFALMADKLFKRRGLVTEDGSKYMPTYWEAFWGLYVLVTTANSPDVM